MTVMMLICRHTRGRVISEKIFRSGGQGENDPGNLMYGSLCEGITDLEIYGGSEMSAFERWDWNEWTTATRLAVGNGLSVS
jgi:hypothetical protein